ncbi:MAG TPA: hypothetical protein VF600_00410 [Abditibacteriaceae bacterium]|jgi:hypothetical protein
MSRILLGAIGLSYGHNDSMAETLQRGGAGLVSFSSPEDEPGAAFMQRHLHAATLSITRAA